VANLHLKSYRSPMIQNQHQAVMDRMFAPVPDEGLPAAGVVDSTQSKKSLSQKAGSLMKVGAALSPFLF
jgi:hypothetical protein